MNITFIYNGKFEILMKEYLEEAIDEFGEKIVATTTPTAQKGLFSVNPDSEMLDEARSKSFRSITAKLLYVLCRARVDLKLSIGFLCTRFTKSTDQDWGRLRRVL